MKKIILVVVAALLVAQFAFSKAESRTDNARGAIAERHAVLSNI